MHPAACRMSCVDLVESRGPRPGARRAGLWRLSGGAGAVPAPPCNGAAAAPARRVAGNDNPAREDSAIWLESLPHDFKSELVQARERGQVKAGEGSVA
jgi:hypothetical protein